MLTDSAGERYSLPRALLWSFTWAFGVALGVALGGWLTLVGGSGAPGAEALDPIADLVVLPGAAFITMLVVQLLARISIAAARGRTHHRGEQHNDDQGAEDDRVGR